MTTTLVHAAHPDDEVRSGFRAAIPRGAQLDARSFRARHRVTTGMLIAHVPVLAVVGLVRGVGGWLLWGQLAVIAVLVVLGLTLRNQVARAAAVGLGLMVGADVLLTSAVASPTCTSGSTCCSRWSRCTPPEVQAAGTALGSVEDVIRGVVDAQGTIAAAVEELSVATAQAQEAIAGASREAASMAADLQRIVAGGH